MGCLNSRGANVDLILVDRNLQVLPKRGAECTVSIKPFCERLGGSDEDLDFRSDGCKELPLGTVQVHRTEQDDFVLDLSHFAVFQGESACGLDIPKARFVQDIKVLTL